MKCCALIHSRWRGGISLLSPSFPRNACCCASMPDRKSRRYSASLSRILSARAFMLFHIFPLEIGAYDLSVLYATPEPMIKPILKHLADETHSLEAQGLFKSERIIVSPQQAEIRVQPADATNNNSKSVINPPTRSVINLCANNYLGLANHPVLVKAAHEALDKYGLGLASVRFICGTQDLHKQLEKKVSEFLKTEDTILYTSCFDANGGLFETLLGEEDAVISDELNHA